MESKKINQLATNVSPQTSDLTIIGDPTTGVSKKITLLQIANLFATTGTVTSVGVTETGDALTITGSPITTAGTINIGFAGAATQYVRGDGALADFPTSTGGGSSVSYYLNSSVSQGTIGGVAYRQLSKVPISGAGTDITTSANGYIASYITDANDPALLEVPAGNFNCEFYFSVNSNSHNPYVYAEIYKYDGTTFTLLGSNVAIPEYLSNGTTLSPYYFAVAVASSVLTVTDRIAIRIYVNVDGRTVTLHTENNHLCQVVTTFSKGLISLNNLTRQNQFFATGTSGTDFNISSTTATHTFNIPDASATNRGLITTGSQTIAGDKSFTGINSFDYGINYKTGASLAGVSGYISQAYATSGTGAGSTLSLKISDGNSVKAINLDFVGSPATYTYTFPAATGTIALTSDLTSGTVTSVAALTLGTTGTDLSSTVANSTTTPVITLNVPTASATNRGALSSADWTTFNNKQAALTNPVTGTGTTNYLSKFTGASAIGNSLIWDNGTNVGIGNTNTSYTLDVSGTGRFTSTLLVSGAATFSSSVQADFLVVGTTAATSGGLRLGTQVAIRARNVANTANIPLIESTASDGVSVSNGALILASTGAATFSSSVAAGGTIQSTTTSTNPAFLSILPANANATILQSYSSNSGFGWKIQQEEVSTGDFRIFRRESSVDYQVLNLARSTGAASFSSNVGIGNSAPTAKLEITNGRVLLNNGYSYQFYNTSSVAVDTLQMFTDGNVYLDAKDSTGGNLIFRTSNSNTERMRITSGGNVGIGANGTNGKLDISMSTTANPLIFAYHTAASPYGMRINYSTTPNNTDNWFIYADDSTALRFSVRSNGGIANYSGNNVNLASDRRLKKDIVPLSSEWEKLKQIEVVNFKYNDSTDETALYGAIAQQVQEVYPDLVVVTREATETEPEYYGLREQPFQWLTTKVLQEAMTKIEEQQIQIQNLQEQINILAK